MLLTKQNENEYTLIGEASEYRDIIKWFMRYSEILQLQGLSELHPEFYQALLNASKNQVEPTRHIVCRSKDMLSLYYVVSKCEYADITVPKCVKDISEQYRALENEEGNKAVHFDYEGYVGVDTYEMILTFLSSFDLEAKDLEELVVGTYIEKNESMTEEKIHGFVWETVYSDFFSMFQELVVETHIILTLKEFCSLLSEEVQEANLNHSEWLWLYLFYLEVMLKLLRENILYQAEDKEMALSWSKPYVLEFVDEMIDGKKELSDLRNVFRSLYIQEMSLAFEGLEKTEDDTKEPYNVVFVLKEKKRVVSNTSKHFEQFIHDVRSGKRIVTEEEIRAYVRSITPSKTANTHKWSDLSWEEVRDSIYPIIRPVDASPKESFSAPFHKGLATFYAIEIKEDGKYQLALIMSKMFESWSVSSEELKSVALKNLQKRSPHWSSYYDRVENTIPKEQLVFLNKPYRETYMIQERNPLNSSYLLDAEKMNAFRGQWGSLVMAIPLRDSIFITSKEHEGFLKTVTNKLYESHPAKLSNDLYEWDGREWKVLEQGQ